LLGSTDLRAFYKVSIKLNFIISLSTFDLVVLKFSSDFVNYLRSDDEHNQNGDVLCYFGFLEFSGENSS